MSFLSDGLSEELLNVLARPPGLQVARPAFNNLIALYLNSRNFDRGNALIGRVDEAEEVLATKTLGKSGNTSNYQIMRSHANYYRPRALTRKS